MCTGTHAYIPATNTAEARLNYLTPGGVAENVLNFRKSGGWSLSDLIDLANAVKDSWETNIAPVVSNNISLDNIVATDLSSDSGPQTTLPAGVSGGINSAVLPSNVTLAISFHTDFRGRSYRGRAFLVGLTEATVTGDTISSGSATAFREAWENFLADIATAVAGTVLVIVSRCSAGAWRTNAVVTDVTSITVDTTVDTMKSRLAGHGI
jgi:hypothetical protein